MNDIRPTGVRHVTPYASYTRITFLHTQGWIWIWHFAMRYGVKEIWKEDSSVVYMGSYSRANAKMQGLQYVHVRGRNRGSIRNEDT